MITLTQLGRATRTEMSKFLSLRSLTGHFAAGILATIALGWLLGASAKASGENGYDTAMLAPLLVLATLQFGQLLFASAVVLPLTGEYSADQIGSNLQAVPQRGVLLAAKSIVVVVSGFLGGVLEIGLGTIPTVMGAESFGVFSVGALAWAALAARGYLALLGLMIIGLGLLTGNSAGGIVAMLMLVIGLPQTLQLVRVDWMQRLTPYLPSNAATFVAAGAAGPYSPGTALFGAHRLGGQIPAQRCLNAVRPPSKSAWVAAELF